MTSIIDDIVPKLRRAIGDTEDKQIYTDIALAEYIEDGIAGIGLRYDHNYTVDRDNHEITEDVPQPEQMLFAMKAKVDILDSQPDISYRTGAISVTRKSVGKRDLQKKLDDMISNLLLLKSIGKSRNEFDTYIDRFETVLYNNKLYDVSIY